MPRGTTDCCNPSGKARTGQSEVGGVLLDRAAGGTLAWLPVALAIVGTLLLLAGGAWMVAESRLSGDQIQEEIRLARSQLEEKPR